MSTIYRACWWPQGADPAAAPVFAVRVGNSARERKAVEQLQALKSSGALYFEVNCPEVLEFWAKLIAAEPSRPIYNVTAVELWRMVGKSANAANVKNLSPSVRRRMLSGAVEHGLCPIYVKSLKIKSVKLC